jgi:hypothetical protein
MRASTPQEIHFLSERAFNIGDVEAILALQSCATLAISLVQKIGQTTC